MTGKQLEQIKDKFSLSNAQMSKLLNISQATFFHWKKKQEINPAEAYLLESLSAMSESERVKYLREKLGTRAAIGTNQNVRAVGVLARALVEQHGFGFDGAFEIAHYQHNIFPPVYSVDSQVYAYERAGRKVPKISKDKLTHMLKLYEERKLQ